jgi:hypothetical protein
MEREIDSVFPNKKGPEANLEPFFRSRIDDARILHEP